MTRDYRRDDRDAIQVKIEALEMESAVLKGKLKTGWRAGNTSDHSDLIGELIDAISDEIAALEADLDEADAAVARDDPECGPWGRDGL